MPHDKILFRRYFVSLQKQLGVNGCFVCRSIVNEDDFVVVVLLIED